MVRMAASSRALNRREVGCVKAGARASITSAAWLGRITAGRPWAVEQEVGSTPMLPPRRPFKTASVELQEVAENLFSVGNGPPRSLRFRLGRVQPAVERQQRVKVPRLVSVDAHI